MVIFLRVFEYCSCYTINNKWNLCVTSYHFAYLIFLNSNFLVPKKRVFLNKTNFFVCPYWRERELAAKFQQYFFEEVILIVTCFSETSTAFFLLFLFNISIQPMFSAKMGLFKNKNYNHEWVLLLNLHILHIFAYFCAYFAYFCIFLHIFAYFANFA